MSLEQCQRCKNFIYSFENSGICKCREFICREDDDGYDPDDGTPVYASHAAAAAEKMIEERNDEGQYIDRDDIVVHVRDVATGKSVKMTVSCHVSVEYNAEIDDDEEEEETEPSGDDTEAEAEASTEEKA